MLDVTRWQYFSVDNCGLMNFSTPIDPILDGLVLTMHCKNSNGRLHGVHRTNQSNCGFKNVNTDSHLWSRVLLASLLLRPKHCYALSFTFERYSIVLSDEDRFCLHASDSCLHIRCRLFGSNILQNISVIDTIAQPTSSYISHSALVEGNLYSGMYAQKNVPLFQEDNAHSHDICLNQNHLMFDNFSGFHDFQTCSPLKMYVYDRTKPNFFRYSTYSCYCIVSTICIDDNLLSSRYIFSTFKLD